MRFRNAFVGILALGVLAAGAQANPSDEGQIGETFVEARMALQGRDGAAALATLSDADRARVERIRRAALDGSNGSLAALMPAERFAALGLRRHLPPAELKKRDAAGLVEYALEQGWLGPNLLRGAGLEKLRIQGNRANGLLLINGQPQLFPAEFVRENGMWRIDLARSVEMADALIRTSALLSKRSEDQVIAELLDKAMARAGKHASH